MMRIDFSLVVPIKTIEMQVYKIRITVPIILLVFFSSCIGLKSEFTRNYIYNRALYSRALESSCPSGDTNLISQIDVYKTAFREKYIEDGSILIHASINDASTREIVDYKPPRTGFAQEMYLVKLTTKCTEPRWYYFSVWYRYDFKKKKQLVYGFGKAYRGVPNEMAGTIFFDKALAITEHRNGFSLVPKSGEQFYLVFDNMDSPILSMNRLVVEAKNKFGGPRSYVFKVDEAFKGDLNRLEFVKQQSRTFN